MAISKVIPDSVTRPTDLRRRCVVGGNAKHYTRSLLTHGARDLIRHLPKAQRTRSGASNLDSEVNSFPVKIPIKRPLRLQVVAEAKVEGFEGEPLPGVTISVGVAEMTAKNTLETFIAVADRALYNAKEGGGNRVSEADRTS
ncbi:hypothetical protein MYX82_05030 [Acidobacteria bacterium AH-259-D05]|nr:hypothetical protein [Acidobacteria bacterium AH-259-D05]